jgi:hypothetical protein
MSIEKVEIDTKDVAAKLSFLVGRTVLFRDGHGDATTASSVLALKAENTPGLNGHPQVAIYTTVGVLTITKSTEFNNIMLLDDDDNSKSIGTYADEMGIYF